MLKIVIAIVLIVAKAAVLVSEPNTFTLEKPGDILGGGLPRSRECQKWGWMVLKTVTGWDVYTERRRCFGKRKVRLRQKKSGWKGCGR
jgi:hypothetical protein